MLFRRTYREHQYVTVIPLYAARIEDLGPSDFLKIDCAACGHTAVRALAFLDRLGPSPRCKVIDLKDRMRGRAVVSI